MEKFKVVEEEVSFSSLIISPKGVEVCRTFSRGMANKICELLNRDLDEKCDSGYLDLQNIIIKCKHCDSRRVDISISPVRDIKYNDVEPCNGDSTPCNIYIQCLNCGRGEVINRTFSVI